jgi:hypothetical protein
MKTILILLALITVLFACSHYDPEYFQDKFRKDTGVNSNVPIKIVKKFKTDSYPLAVGLCYYNPTPNIEILESFWLKSSDTLREILIYHELGHCALNRVEHSQIKIGNYSTSLMYPIIPHELEYLSCKDEYIEELLARHIIPISSCLFKLQNIKR